MRVVFDLSFFLIIIIMFLNIIFGIIIDTFAELRENSSFINDDMLNTCFICNIDRQTVRIISIFKNQSINLTLV